MRFLALILPLLATTAKADETCIEMSSTAAVEAVEEELLDLFNRGMLALERAASLLETIYKRSPELCYASQLDGAHGYFDVDQNRIYISDALSKDMQVGVFLHEVRHLDQIEIGVCISDDLAMREYVEAVFALEADASAITLMIAWGLKEQGKPSVWHALSSWDTQSNIASRFAEEMNASGDLGSAVSAAFEQWYASDFRRTQYYLSTCSEYLDRKDTTHAIPRYLLLPTDFYAELCKLPNGLEYQCSAPEAGISRTTPR
jgi:hypothetical protein